jgi:ribonuclease Z
MQLTILGCGGALPAYGRYPSAQILNTNECSILIDCGEGAQMKMQQYKVKQNRIHHVCISHMHGDHYFGLVGFINSQGLLGRTQTLNIYAPAKLKEIIALQTEWKLPFEIIYHDLLENKYAVLFENEKLKIEAFPVEHSVPTHGFKFTKKVKLRSLLPNKLREYEIPKYFYSKLADGEDYERQDGTIIKNELVTIEGKGNKSYAYCSDTRYTESIIPYIKNVNLLYHEATYLHELAERAHERHHSTTTEAASIAKLAQVDQLIIGHYSSKYKTLEGFKEEATIVFNNVLLAEEDLVVNI